MYLVFFSTGNEEEYTPQTFDGLDHEDIIEKVREMYYHDTEAVRVYDMGKGYGETAFLDGLPCMNAADFMQDYNGKLLDGGWWCVMFDKEEKAGEQADEDPWDKDWHQMEQEVVKLFKEGRPFSEIAAKTGAATQTVKDIIIKHAEG